MEKEEIKQEDVNSLIYDIDIKMEKLYVSLDSLSIKMDSAEEYSDEYFNLKDEYDKIKNEIRELGKIKKDLLKESKSNVKGEKSVFEDVSIWVIIYGIIMFIINIPGVSYNVWLGFSNVIIDLLSDALDMVNTDNKAVIILIYALLIYALPLLLELLSWIIYANAIKKKADKKVFKYIWIMQTVLSIGLMIYMGIKFFPNIV